MRGPTYKPDDVLDKSGVRRVTPAPPGAVLRLQQAAGNAAVSSLVQRQKTAAPPAPKPAKDMRVNITRTPGDTIEFTTKTAKLGNVEVHFTGRLSLSGAATFEGEDIPEAKDLPKATKTRSATAIWATNHVRDAVEKALNDAVPTGSEQEIVLDIGGEKAVLDLAGGFAGLPGFAVSGHFSPGKKDLQFGTLTIPKASLSLDLTAWIQPVPSSPFDTPRPPAGEDAISSFAWAGDHARFAESKSQPRTGALAQWDSIRKLEKELPKVVLDHPFMKLPEQRVAFLQEMRGYFGSDEKTIAHFKNLRKVNIRGSNLIMHDEAATRLEAVQAEIGAANMPATDIGWPRAECSVGGHQIIGNLHNIGFAVDFNATETPNLKSNLQRDLIALVTGKVEMSTGKAADATDAYYYKYTGGSGGGDYDEMLKHTEQRSVMADPDANSDLGKLLTRIQEEAQDMSDRSEKFRHSLDVKDASTGTTTDGAASLLELRKLYRGGTWGDAEKAKLGQVTKPWHDLVDAELLKQGKAISDAGFSLSSLPQGAALDKEQATLSAAVAGVATLHKKAKDGVLGKQRAAAEKLLKDLRAILGTDSKAEPADLDDQALLDELDKLVEKAKTRLAAYGKVRWYERVQDLQKGLDDPSLVFGSTDQAQVVDPSLTQLADRGFYTLKPFSHSAGGGAAQEGAFTVEFVRAMVKHGFHLGSKWSAGPGFGTDSMHFELRWRPRT